MKRIIFVFFIFVFSHIGFTQSLYFPPVIGNTWDTVSPSSLGWCDDQIDSLLDYLEDRDSKAFILLKD